MERTFSVVYLILFLGMLIINLKIFLVSNFHKLFKKGRVNQIRVFYVVFSIILSYLFASAIVKFLEEIYKLA